MADTNDASAASAYEAKRLQRMQQNQQMLQSLGILLPPRERKRRVSTRDDQDDDAEPVERRRSSRLQLDGAAEPAALLDLDSLPRRPRRVLGPSERPVKPKTNEEKAKAPHRFSTLANDMDTAAFHDRWLGKQLWPGGIRSVMNAMCTRHRQLFFFPHEAHQWRNGAAIFADAPGSPLSSVDRFTEHGATVHFRWQSLPSQTESSPAVARLARSSPNGDHALWLDGAVSPPSSDTSRIDTVQLFVRHVEGPFVYCGRLGYLGHLGSEPVEFRWQLLDLDAVQWRRVRRLLDTAAYQPDDAVKITSGGAVPSQ